jgi:hypothetical protein
VTTGETLYRDVFFGVTPLSLYILAGLTKAFGTDILVLKLAGCVVSTAVMLLCCRVWHELRPRRYSVALILALFVFASPGTIAYLSFYSNVANCFLVAALWVLLVWVRDRREFFLIVAGVLLGLAILAKQNFGAYGCIALALGVVSVSVSERRGARWAIARVSRAAGACVAVVLIGLLPVFLQGGLPGLIDYGFLGKGRYLALGRVSYFDAITRAMAVALPTSAESLRAIRTLIPFLFAPLLVPLLAVALPRMSMERRLKAIIVMLFVLASIAGVYPRADPHHLVFAVPFLLIAILMCWNAIASAPYARIARVLGYSTLGAAALLIFTEGARRALSPANIPSPFRHFGGSLIDRTEAAHLAANLRVIGSLQRDGRTFIIAQNAAFYYLAGGLRNPTPFDYPFVMSFGRTGEERTIRMIAEGRIMRVCVDKDMAVEMQPGSLISFVKSRMKPISSDASCKLYVQ